MKIKKGIGVKLKEDFEDFFNNLDFFQPFGGFYQVKNNNHNKKENQSNDIVSLYKTTIPFKTLT